MNIKRLLNQVAVPSDLDHLNSHLSSKLFVFSEEYGPMGSSTRHIVA